ncbi:tRNA1(Val) (adenine(37)-N6)-methyltransferase [Shewanella cyperi]|uniref:tRNA1(Val) (adenine(37)-N6)-methyltransferase n=1 Tax=Shewanella cyperi TaxID=2814292 RepID=A0A975AJM7_9GAMM|nr:methyltransferase [Shewanella cyperi]QSX29235.1 methyltransferase [Shewanella cyperi]QSX39980.1 methyltransferase [Shewanella cyperi]
MPFSFKQFHIDDRNCGMPVSTDGVLLGAWSRLPITGRVLDIGAGSGLLSLMAAQRCPASIVAIEIESGAAEACRRNFAASPWNDRLQLLEGDVQQLALDTPPLANGFEHIVCNPPYFSSGPQSSKQGRAQARHDNNLSLDKLLRIIAQLLTPLGRASLILPTDAEGALLAAADGAGLCLSRRTLVQSVPGKAPNRLLLEIGPGQQILEHASLCIRDETGHYSHEMAALTRDFYLNL